MREPMMPSPMNPICTTPSPRRARLSPNCRPTTLARGVKLVQRLVGSREGSMELGIKGLRVLVTAGATGIGREVARAFAGEGAKVYVCDIDRKALAALKRSDPKIRQSVADVADRSEVERLFKDALKALG